MGIPYLNSAFCIYLIIIVSHQEDLHEVVKVAVEDALRVGGLVAGAQVLDHLVGMKNVAADLGTPLDLLFLAFELGLLFLTLLEFDVIKSRFQDSEGILTVVQLRARLSVLNDNTRRNMPHTHSCLDLVDILSAGST